MKRKTNKSEIDIFLDEDIEGVDEIDDGRYVLNSETFNGEDIEDLFEEEDESEEDPDDSDDSILSYKDYAMKKSNTKKVTSQNYDSADLHNAKQDIAVPHDCANDEDYFNEALETDACEIIKGTSLDKYEDGRHIPIKDVVTCFVKLSDKWPDDLVYCFTLMATYGKVLRYKSLLDAIPTSYRDKMISQLSSNGAELIRSLYKGEATVMDIFC